MDSAIQLLNENCHYDDIEWAFAFTFHMAFKNIVDTGIVFKEGHPTAIFGKISVRKTI